MEGKEWLVGDEGGCGFAPPLIGGIEGSCLEGVTSSPYRNSREKLMEIKKRDTNTRKLEMEPRTVLTIALEPEGISADNPIAIILTRR